MKTKEEIKKEIIDVVNEYILDDERNEKHFNAILEIVKKHDGKPIGKRFLDDVKKIYPNSFYRLPTDSMIYVQLVDTGRVGLVEFLLFNSFSSVKKISVSEFKRCSTFAQESEHGRIAMNKHFLASKDLDTMTEYYCKLFEAKVLLSNLEDKDIPAEYAIARKFGLKLDKYN